MELVWQTQSWEDYLYWQQIDKKVLQRINDLIKDTLRTSFKGIGKPEPLKGNYTGCWSRRITNEIVWYIRLRIKGYIFLQCGYHYQ